VGERTIDLSILMPAYDERATLERAIDAVLEMDLPTSYELIVIDDGSRDGNVVGNRAVTFFANVENRARSREEGKKLTALGLRVLWTLLSRRLSS
jgi:hypothetical protein